MAVDSGGKSFSLVVHGYGFWDPDVPHSVLAIQVVEIVCLRCGLLPKIACSQNSAGFARTPLVFAKMQKNTLSGATVNRSNHEGRLHEHKQDCRIALRLR